MNLPPLTNEESEKIRKPKGKVSSVISSEAKNYVCPPVTKVATEITADNPKFEPASRVGTPFVEVSANVASRVSFGHRTTLRVDCGFSMSVPAGFVVRAAPLDAQANKGLFISSAPLSNGRIVLTATNIGKEVLTLEPGEKFAVLSVEPAISFDFKVK